MNRHNRLVANGSHQTVRYFRLYETYAFKQSRRTLEFRIKDRVLNLVLSDSRTHQVGGYKEHWVKPSTELLLLSGALLVDAVMPSIVADRLQEQHPELEHIASFLREWELTEKANP